MLFLLSVTTFIISGFTILYEVLILFLKSLPCTEPIIVTFGILIGYCISTSIISQPIFFPNNNKSLGSSGYFPPSEIVLTV